MPPPPRRKSDDGPNDAASAAAVRDDATRHLDGEENDGYDGYYEYDEYDVERYWPSRPLLVYKASCIALFDIFAQSMVYAGNNLAGPTIFSIIYSSVTIWAALYSKLLLDRSLSTMQWMGVFCVVSGLSLAALDSKSMGGNVFLGAVLIVVGTSGHGLTYVFSEKIMTTTTTKDEDKKKNGESTMATLSSTASTSSSTRTASSTRSGTDDAADHHRNHGNAQQPPIREGSSSRLRLRQRRDHHHRRRRDDDDDRGDDIISVRANCAIQGLVASSVLFAWQLVYTLPNIRTLILLPMSKAGTSPPQALLVLSAISLSNLLHSATFFVALKHLAGGATSAGVLKGLQAVLVFAASSALLCGRWEGTGEEMCWSASKLVSLSVVLCGIGLYAGGTRQQHGGGGATNATATTRKKTTADDDDDDDDDDDNDDDDNDDDGGIMCV